MLLDDIVLNKKEEVAALKSGLDINKIKQAVESLSLPQDFKTALTKGKISLIAEVKKASPSAGIILKDFNPAKLAGIYEKNGASAISVLTDEKFFQGSLENLAAVKKVTELPVLRKDFIIDEVQIYESRLAGADAILLIVRILTLDELSRFIYVAKSLKLQCLVEAHNEEELGRALKSGAEIIGINNRDLDSLKIDFQNTLSLMDKYPEIKSRIVVSESGINSREQVERLEEKGVKAILVGESLLRSEDVGSKIRELMGSGIIIDELVR